jgi:hypothetical protein
VQQESNLRQSGKVDEEKEKPFGRPYAHKKPPKQCCLVAVVILF